MDGKKGPGSALSSLLASRPHYETAAMTADADIKTPRN